MIGNDVQCAPQKKIKKKKSGRRPNCLSWQIAEIFDQDPTLIFSPTRYQDPLRSIFSDIIVCHSDGNIRHAREPHVFASKSKGPIRGYPILLKLAAIQRLQSCKMLIAQSSIFSQNCSFLKIFVVLSALPQIMSFRLIL